MQVIYRITDIPSSNPSPVYQDDKAKLNKLCLHSFIRGFQEVKPKVIFLADHMNDVSYLEKFPWDHEVIRTEDGQNKAMLNSYEIASKLEDCILFNEADHLWLPNSGGIMLQAIKELGLVSGYDHPDFYTRFDIHSKTTEVVISGDHHFRKSTRNVMSWGCHSSLVKENLDILNHHGYLDEGVWSDLKERGHDLYTAIPALSTHMVKDYLAPGIDWKELWTTLI